MSNKSNNFKIISYGIYDSWDSKTSTLPKIVRFCDEIPARIDIEFGFIVNIKQNRGNLISWCIDHPGILDNKKKRRAPFAGTQRIKSADWSFFLGDTIWDPINDKLGNWNLWIKLDKTIIAQKTFHIVNEQWSHPL